MKRNKLKIEKGDKPVYRGRITSVGADCISFDGGTIGVGRVRKYMKVGVIVELYGRSLWSSIRGIVVDGHIVRYRTAAQDDARNDRLAAKFKRDSLGNYKKALPALEASYAELPPAFRKRMDRLRKKNPDTRHEWEAYEMFVVTEAVKLAEALKTPEKVEEFAKADSDTQRTMAPDIVDGHSGNTWGGMCKLAYRHLKGMEL